MDCKGQLQHTIIRETDYTGREGTIIAGKKFRNFLKSEDQVTGGSLDESHQ